ncbi:MAG TPA: immunoglobulin domain-containing protein [Verrucomicrobiae bacterium]|nr:immunoglobulin domain-containing protein [Verrucomicrobiae bacterium]
MKKILVPLVVGMLFTSTAHAAVQSLPFTDHFSYTNGNLYTVGAGVWDAGGNAGPEILVTNTAALTAPANFTNSTGNGVKWTPSGTARRAMVQFTAISSNTPGTTLYASFLVNLVSVSGTKLFAYFDNSTSQPSSPQLGIFATSTSIGIGKKASSPAASITVGSGTHLVVVRYTFTGTSTDQADLWVDPTNTTYSATNAPTSMGTASGGSNPSSIPYFGIYAISGSGPTLNMDEVRIGTNWYDVVVGTPPAPPPPPASALQVTQVQMTDQGFVMQGIGGSSNGVFSVLASTDMTLTTDQWTTVGTYNFDANGNFNVTNPVPDGTANEFFILYTSSAATTTPPSISSEPSDQVVQLGEGVSFGVTADGSQPLFYQWYVTSNTVLSAGTNATYTIASVSSNDVGGYFVIVSNMAGSTTSTVAQLTLGVPVTNGDYYVSNTGTDTNDGSFAHPFYNIQTAADLAQPGQTIYVRGGTYPYVNTIRLQGHPGANGAMINLFAYPGEHPILDFSSQPIGDSSRGIYLTNDYWYIKGLEVEHCGDNGMKVEGSHNIIEQCIFHDNQDSGLQIGFSHPTVNDGTRAAYNTILNCDSYHNYDNATHGGNADGFGCKMHPGVGNIFIGCRSWYNSDDGFDFFETDSTVILTNCWTWHSGDKSQFNTSSFGGNGNGFKMGGNGSGGDSKGTHYAYNCIAFNNSYGNSKNDFTDNNHADGENLYNCVAWGGNYNFFFEQNVNSGKSNVFKNCVSFAPAGNSGNPVKGVSFGGGTVIQDHNTWTIPLNASSADFNSIAEADAAAPRQPDGSLPTSFGHLVAGSQLIDSGVDVGLPYCGSAPDLGAYEYCP